MRYLLIAAVFMVVGCAPAGEDEARAHALVAGFADRAVGDTLDLVAILGEDWDRMAVMGPYGDNDAAEEMLGFPFDYERATEWVHSEGGWLVVLASGQSPAAWFKIRYGEIDLTCLDGEVFAANPPSVEVGAAPGGRKILGPVDRPNCYLR